MYISANNPERESWINVPKNSDFPIQNIPFGVFITKDDIVTIGTRIGDTVIDLGAMQQLGYFKSIKLSDDVFLQDTLNDFISHGRKRWREVRNRLAELFDKNNPDLKDNQTHQKTILFDIHEVEMLMPIDVVDYTDFYSSEHHAINMHKIYFGEDKPMTKNWRHIPLCYHGRSSSVVVSGTSIRRPKGQIKDENGMITYRKTQQLDFEIEMGFITTDGNHIGGMLNIDEAEEHIFGMVILNDWSARDIQNFETNPLGPYLSKNFATTISPWIVTLDALEPFRVNGPIQDPPPLPYLQKSGKHGFDIMLNASITSGNNVETLVSETNFKDQYWTIDQQLTHHTSNGCNLRSGDLFGTGAISSSEKSGYGSMLELSWNGTENIPLKDGSIRTFLQDYDTVMLHGYCKNKDVRIGFGNCIGKILPLTK
jgi:fumarylacetoacetase